MKLSEHLTLDEMTHSATAEKLGIDNTPPISIVNKLSIFAKTIFEPLREIVNAPIIVTSGYRCPELERAISGRAYGQHMLGEAADMICLNMTASELYQVIKNQNVFAYGQLILERIGGKEWVHVSFGLKRQNLLAYEMEGQIKYKEDEDAGHAPQIS